MNRVNELLDHVKTQMLLADKRRCDAIEKREPSHTITYWTGRQSAWIEAADLILHYMKGELEDESQI